MALLGDGYEFWWRRLDSNQFDVSRAFYGLKYGILYSVPPMLTVR